jgi:hypothetical protein
MSAASDNLARFSKSSASSGKAYTKSVRGANARYNKAIGNSLRKSGKLSMRLGERRRIREVNLKELQQRFVASTSKVLNEAALSQLATHAKIDAPTLTSIFSGYEHARASEADRQQILVKDLERTLLRDNQLDKDIVAQSQRDLAVGRQLSGANFDTSLKIADSESRRSDRTNDREFTQSENARGRNERNADTIDAEGRRNTRQDEVYGRNRTDRNADTIEAEGRRNTRQDTVYDRNLEDRREDATTAFGRRDKSDAKAPTPLEATLRAMAKRRKESTSTSTSTSTSKSKSKSTSAPAPSDTHEQPQPQPPSFLELLGRAESGEAGYNAFNRGQAGDSLGETMDLSTLTVGDIKRLQSLPREHPDRLFAVGAYQMIPSTFDQITKKLGIRDGQMMTEDLQDEMLIAGLIPKQPELFNYLTSTGEVDIDVGVLGAAKEWAGFADPTTGLSRHGKVGSNRANVDSATLSKTLKFTRDQTQTLILSGATPEEALMIAIVGSKSAPAPAPAPSPAPAPAPVDPLSSARDATLDALAIDPNDATATQNMAALDLIDSVGGDAAAINDAMVETVAQADNTTLPDEFDQLAQDDERERLAALQRASELYSKSVEDSDYDTYS